MVLNIINRWWNALLQHISTHMSSVWQLFHVGLSSLHVGKTLRWALGDRDLLVPAAPWESLTRPSLFLNQSRLSPARGPADTQDQGEFPLSSLKADIKMTRSSRVVFRLQQLPFLPAPCH